MKANTIAKFIDEHLPAHPRHFCLFSTGRNFARGAEVFFAFLTLVLHKGGFPFSAKCRAINFLRSLSFEMCAVSHSRSTWLFVFQKKAIAKSWSRDILHWMEIPLKSAKTMKNSARRAKFRLLENSPLGLTPRAKFFSEMRNILPVSFELWAIK